MQTDKTTGKNTKRTKKRDPNQRKMLACIEKRPWNRRQPNCLHKNITDETLGVPHLSTVAVFQVRQFFYAGSDVTTLTEATPAHAA
eukprot:5475138-Amphidinium_carterae.1